MTLKKSPPKQTNGNHRMPQPSTLFQDIRSTFSLRNVPRTTQSQTVQEDRQEGPMQEPRKEGEGTASVSYPQSWSWYCGVWGLETRFTQVLSPLFRDALSPYLASCCQQKV